MAIRSRIKMENRQKVDENQVVAVARQQGIRDLSNRRPIVGLEQHLAAFHRSRDGCTRRMASLNPKWWSTSGSWLWANRKSCC